eukprot:1753033-Amphidinium_carterae.1
MEAESNEDRIYELNENNIEYMTHTQGDTDEDDVRLRQIEHLEDDIQSIDDDEHYNKRRQEELDRPEQIYWERQALERHQHEMDEAYRWESARDR